MSSKNKSNSSSKQQQQPSKSSSSSSQQVKNQQVKTKLNPSTQGTILSSQSNSTNSEFGNYSSLTSCPSTKQSACCILIPSQHNSDNDQIHTLFDHIQHIRQEWDKSFSRWEPHLNLLYPFIHKKNFFQARQCIEDIVQQHELHAFQVDFPAHHVYCREFSKFVLTSPCDTSQLEKFQQIYQLLKEVFPQCSATGSLQEQSSSSKESTNEIFHPHLTLGQLSNSNLANVKYKQLVLRKGNNKEEMNEEWNEFEKLKQSWMGGSFKATEIVLLWRENVEDPFHVAERISLL
ncbi:hypothetical protein C9374_011039 [Naegleria lovaniensis]|uniref:Uncharacterized protein n=1 Tax=Naegleria lovaniensis TaxID=51637 RepID=A0AA88GEM6_NAELO|nr:uncharacterized protein C9374_011039 [Naegleria lovaniensis]KAG2374202.1 hypothetical protein C9374_011039 [Naegleria lovaniensis]